MFSEVGNRIVRGSAEMFYPKPKHKMPEFLQSELCSIARNKLTRDAKSNKY
jgi:hypothetical protein